MGERGEMDPIQLQEIPIELTKHGKVISIKKDNDPNNCLFGMVKNGQIKVGKPINFSGDRYTTEVVSIEQVGDEFVISTISGSKYYFNPRESADYPLKNE